MKGFSITEKAIKEKIKRKNWDHDICYIDGVFVEDIVEEYKRTNNEELLLKILKNYEMYKSSVWARAFAPYCDNDLEAGGAMYDEIIWKSALKFDMAKGEKEKGKAFNAYCVSACLNQLKNHLSAKKSHKNSPRVTCPVCNEQVYQIDHKHLTHVIVMERYKKTYRKYPLVSTDGNVICPISGKSVPEITEQHLNFVNNTYTVEDFEHDYKHLYPSKPLRCPVTNIQLGKITSNYPSVIMDGFDEEDFIQTFPDFAGIITCPFSGKKVLEITQRHLDQVLGQKVHKDRYTIEKFLIDYPNATLKARQDSVTNPYTNEIVPEITLEMLDDAGTTLKEHFETYAQLYIDQYYAVPVVCPFTGRKTHKITRDFLTSIGKTVYDFYHAVCKYPLRKWSVKCGVCGDYVSNVWEHLITAQHNYAPRMNFEEFETAHGACPTKAIISTNSFFVNESGDSVHIGDLFPKEREGFDPLEVEDSLTRVAEDELELKIARAVREAQTLEDICYYASEKMTVSLPAPFVATEAKFLRENIVFLTGLEDFDIVRMPAVGAANVEIMLPGRGTIERKLAKMKENSDLVLDEAV